MYQIENNMLRSGRSWLTVDLAEFTLKELYAKYDDLWLIMSHPLIAVDDIVVDMEFYRSKLDLDDRTAMAWLEDNGDTTIHFIGYVKDILKKKEVFQYNLWQTDLKAEVAINGQHPDHEVNENIARDLRITKDDMDYQDAYSRYLVSVNGFIHTCDASEHGLYVLDAFHNAKCSGENEVSLIDFGPVGGFTYVPIDKDSIVNRGVILENDAVEVKTDFDLTDKTVFAVVCGFLITVDGVARVTGPRSLRLDLTNIRMDERYLTASRYLDFSGFDTPHYFEDSHSPNYLNSPEFFAAALENKHSFLVVVDQDKLYREETHMDQLGFPGKFASVRPPRGIVRTENGLIANYTTVGHKKDFVVSIPDHRILHPIYTTRRGEDTMLIANDTEMPGVLPKYQDAFEVNLFTYNT